VPHLLVWDERVEHADCVGPAADARDDRVGEAAHLVQHLKGREGEESKLFRG
jgi:hypothetical protein